MLGNYHFQTGSANHHLSPLILLSSGPTPVFTEHLETVKPDPQLGSLCLQPCILAQADLKKEGMSWIEPMPPGLEKLRSWDRK